MYSAQIERDLQLTDKIFHRKMDSKLLEKTIKSAESGERLKIEDAAVLLRAEDNLLRQRIVNAAGVITNKHHGV